jgi:hypothetical protein
MLESSDERLQSHVVEIEIAGIDGGVVDSDEAFRAFDAVLLRHRLNDEFAISR